MEIVEDNTMTAHPNDIGSSSSSSSSSSNSSRSSSSSSSSGSSNSNSVGTSLTNADKTLYGFDQQALEKSLYQKLWMKDPKYFKKVKIAPSATIKMMAHAQSGVDKGVSRGGNPIEVMGLLVGRMDVEDPQCFVVTDACPVPAEGFETSVVIDDENVINYMIQLAESIEITRKEKIFGWYHTHPFDYDPNAATGHCYLSSTDVTTQLQWQRTEDQSGRSTPWLAIVIDPLRSLARGRPELMAFRVYPPEYQSPSGEAPDGKILSDTQGQKLWGSCWRRYYRLEVTYFMSSLAQQTFRILKDNFFWIDSLSTVPGSGLDKDRQEAEIEEILDVANKINLSNGATSMKSSTTADASVAAGGGSASVMYSQESSLAKATSMSTRLAVECCQGCSTNLVRQQLFMTALTRMGDKDSTNTTNKNQMME